MKEEEKRMLFHYQSIEGIGYKTIMKLLKHIGVKNDVGCVPGLEEWEDIGKIGEDELTMLVGKSKALKLIVGNRKKSASQKAYDNMIKAKIAYVTCFESVFPDKLRNIYDPPVGLFYYGKMPSDNSMNVAVIGARLCSEYGKYVADGYARILGGNGCGVISGMALGIDAVGQKGALDAGGYSMGVLGNGVDICYPAENKVLYERLKEEGGVMSEYPPGTMPKKTYFPMRNRLISGLSDVLLVVEARKKSGTLITADRALEQGKDVYAVPGRVTDALSYGCNRLISEGAGVAVSPQEFLDEIMKDRVTIKNELCKQDKGLMELKRNGCLMDVALEQSLECPILRAIGITPVSLQEWYEKYLIISGEKMEIAVFSAEVFKLLLRKKVKKIDGSGYYCRQDAVLNEW